MLVWPLLCTMLDRVTYLTQSNAIVHLVALAHINCNFIEKLKKKNSPNAELLTSNFRAIIIKYIPF